MCKKTSRENWKSLKRITMILKMFFFTVSDQDEALLKDMLPNISHEDLKTFRRGSIIIWAVIFPVLCVILLIFDKP